MDGSECNAHVHRHPRLPGTRQPFALPACGTAGLPRGKCSECTQESGGCQISRVTDRRTSPQLSGMAFPLWPGFQAASWEHLRSGVSFGKLLPSRASVTRPGSFFPVCGLREASAV
jgi:hypothetical protein